MAQLCIRRKDVHESGQFCRSRSNDSHVPLVEQNADRMREKALLVGEQSNLA